MIMHGPFCEVCVPKVRKKNCVFDNHSVQFEAGRGCFSYFYQFDLVELETNKHEPFSEACVW